MSRLTDPLSNNTNDPKAVGGQRPVRRAIEGKFVCPFCGSVNARTDEPCPTCNMENTPATRNSTRGRIGPWYVLQKSNPAAPGMKYETLIKFIRKGRILPRAVLRGPTTTQLWRFAASVKGVSREFGLCYNCAGDIDPQADNCPHCGRDQTPPLDPDVLLETSAARKAPEPVAAVPDSLNFAELEDSLPGVPVPPEFLTAHAELPAAPKPTLDPHAGAPPRPAPRPAPVVPPQPDPAAIAAAEVARLEREQAEIDAARITREQAPRDPSKGAAPTLSPQELANAFQLDFSGQPKRRKRRRGGKLSVAIFLLLLIIGGAVAAYFKLPQVQAWTNDTYAQASTQVQQWIAQIQGTATKPASSGGVPDNLTLKAQPSTPNTPTVPMATKPPIVPTTPQATPAIPSASAVTAGAQTDKPATIARPPAIDTSTMTLDEAYDRSKKLWGQALDAEAHNDWSGAVVYYEQIKQLPQKAWPNSLNLRLTEARGHVGG